MKVIFDPILSQLRKSDDSSKQDILNKLLLESTVLDNPITAQSVVELFPTGVKTAETTVSTTLGTINTENQYDMKFISQLRISDSRALIAFRDAYTTTLKTRIIDLNLDGTIVPRAATSVTTTDCAFTSLVPLSDGRILLVFDDGITNTIFSSILTISGNLVTATTPVVITLSAQALASKCVDFGNDKSLLVFLDKTNALISAVILSVSGTTVTPSTITSISSEQCRYESFGVTRIGTTSNAIVSYVTRDMSNITINTLNVNTGTNTITAGTEIAVETSPVTEVGLYITNLNDTDCILHYINETEVGKFILLRTNGLLTNILSNIIYSPQTGWYIGLERYNNNSFYTIVKRDDEMLLECRYYTVKETIITLSQAVPISYPKIGESRIVKLSSSKLLFMHTDMTGGPTSVFGTIVPHPRIPDKVLGIATESKNVGETIKIAIAGEVSGFNGLSNGSYYYISDSGQLSTTINSYPNKIGLATNANSLRWIDYNMLDSELANSSGILMLKGNLATPAILDERLRVDNSFVHLERFDGVSWTVLGTWGGSFETDKIYLVNENGVNGIFNKVDDFDHVNFIRATSKKGGVDVGDQNVTTYITGKSEDDVLLSYPGPSNECLVVSSTAISMGPGTYSMEFAWPNKTSELVSFRGNVASPSKGRMIIKERDAGRIIWESSTESEYIATGGTPSVEPIRDSEGKIIEYKDTGFVTIPVNPTAYLYESVDYIVTLIISSGSNRGDGTFPYLLLNGLESNSKTIASKDFVNEQVLTAGVYTKPTITDNGNNTITLSDGEYVFYDNAFKKGPLHKVTISSSSYALDNNAINYVVGYWNYAIPRVRITTNINEINQSDVIPIATIPVKDGMHILPWGELGVGLPNKISERLVKTQRFVRESGLELTTSGTRNVNIATGVVWYGATSVTLSAVQSATSNIKFYHHVGGVWMLSPNVTQFNNTQYDDGTNLVSLASNKYTVNWIYRGVETSSHIYMTLGNNSYSLSEAIAAQPPAPPTFISAHAILVGRIIAKNGVDIPQSVTSAFDVTFTGSSVSPEMIGATATTAGQSGLVPTPPSGAQTKFLRGDGVWDKMEWTAYTPTITGSVTNPTLATTKTLIARYRVVGKNLQIAFTYYSAAGTGAVMGSGAYLFSLPTGFSIDTTVCPIITTPTSVVGDMCGVSASTLGNGIAGAASSAIPCVVVGSSTSTVSLFVPYDSSNAVMNTLIGSAGFHTVGAGKYYKFTAEIPIV